MCLVKVRAEPDEVVVPARPVRRQASIIERTSRRTSVTVIDPARRSSQSRLPPPRSSGHRIIAPAPVTKPAPAPEPGPAPAPPPPPPPPPAPAPPATSGPLVPVKSTSPRTSHHTIVRQYSPRSSRASVPDGRDFYERDYEYVRTTTLAPPDHDAYRHVDGRPRTHRHSLSGGSAHHPRLSWHQGHSHASPEGGSVSYVYMPRHSTSSYHSATRERVVVTDQDGRRREFYREIP